MLHPKADEAYQRELELSRQKLADQFRPASITAELVDDAEPAPGPLPYAPPPAILARDKPSVSQCPYR